MAQTQWSYELLFIAELLIRQLEQRRTREGIPESFLKDAIEKSLTSDREAACRALTELRQEAPEFDEIISAIYKRVAAI